MSTSASSVTSGEGITDGECFDNFERLRRQKRLRLNRESARARRNRNKERMEVLEQEKNELMVRHQQILEANKALTARVQRLEADLAVCRSTISSMEKKPTFKMPTQAPPALTSIPNSQILAPGVIQKLLNERSLADKLLQEKIMMEQALLDSSASSSTATLAGLRHSGSFHQFNGLTGGHNGRNASIKNLLAINPDLALQVARNNRSNELQDLQFSSPAIRNALLLDRK